MEPEDHRTKKQRAYYIAQWCDQNGFTKDTYHYWQKRVRAAALDAAGTTVKAPSDANSLFVQSGPSPAFAEPSFIHLDIVPALERVTVNDANVHLNPEYLVNINEKVTGRIDIELIDAAETVIQQKSENIDVRAYDEWLGTTQYPELLASYIMPNHPVYGSVISDGADILKDWGLDNQFDGYLSEDPNRVLQMGAAIYEALRKRNMLYVVSKSGYSLIGQRIRLCDQVLSQKQGNCLDLSLLYAGALEAVGINPLLILTSDHAFVGFWLEQKNFPNVVQDDASNITNLLPSGTTVIIKKGGKSVKVVVK